MQFVPGSWSNPTFLASFDDLGNRKWGTFISPDFADADIVCNSTRGTLYTASYAGIDNNLSPAVTPGTHQTEIIGENSFMLLEFDTTGKRIWGTYYGGGTYAPAFNVLAMDNHDNLYFASTTISETNISTPGSFQEALSAADSVEMWGMPTSGQNALLVRWAPVGVSIANTIFDTICIAGDSYKVAVTNNGRMPINNVAVTCIYTNINTGIEDSVKITSAALIAGGATLQIDLGSLNIVADETYSLKSFISHTTDDANFANDTTTQIVYAKDCASLSVNNMNQKTENVSVYPNPAVDKLYIDFKTSGEGEYSILNAAGALLHKQSIMKQATMEEINVKAYPPGMYILRVRLNGQVLVKSFQVLK